MSVASPEVEAVEFRSLQLACRDSAARNENLQEQMANVQVSLSEANSRVGELQARLSSHQQSFSQSRALSHILPTVLRDVPLAGRSATGHRGRTRHVQGNKVLCHPLAHTCSVLGYARRDAMHRTDGALPLLLCDGLPFTMRRRMTGPVRSMPCKARFSFCCSQAPPHADSPLLQSRGDPANLQGYVVQHEFMTGVTFNREGALASQGGARNLSDWLFKPGHHLPEEPERLTTPLIEINRVSLRARVVQPPLRSNGIDWHAVCKLLSTHAGVGTAA